MTELPVTTYFTHWRELPLGDREIIEGFVDPAHAEPSPALARAIERWPGAHYWDNSSPERTLVLVAEDRAPRERWWVHALLFVLTLLSMTVAGAMFAGMPSTWTLPSWAFLRVGLGFSIPLAAILAAHESGHYLVARKYRVNASPPYFLPMPPQLMLLGTMGAFIRLRSPLYDRRTLFDIGVAGPFAGMLVALPILLIGLAHSGTRGARRARHSRIRSSCSTTFSCCSAIRFCYRCAEHSWVRRGRSRSRRWRLRGGRDCSSRH